MNPNSAPLEILWTAIGFVGLAITALCYHYADLDRRRVLYVPQMNGVLNRVAQEAIEREITRFVVLMLVTFVGIVALYYPPPPDRPDQGAIAIAGVAMLVGMETLLLVSAVRTLRFRAWLLRQDPELKKATD